LQEVRSAFVETAETVGAERLENSGVNVGVVVLEKSFAIDLGVFGDAIEIVIEKLLAELGRKIGFRVEEQRGQIVLQRALAATLIVEEIRLAVAEHDVAGLKVAVEKKIAFGTEEEFGKALEIVFERLFVERNAGEAEEIIFEIVEIPDDGLAIETSAGITDGIVEVAAGFDLKSRKSFNDFTVDVDYGRRDYRAIAMFGEKFEKRCVAEVFFEVGSFVERFAINFGDGQAVTAEVAGEFEKSEIFFADIVEDADGGGAGSSEANDLTAGAAEFALEREDTLGGFVEVGFEESLKDFHYERVFLRPRPID